jgi:hypothetical protein
MKEVKQVEVLFDAMDTGGWHYIFPCVAVGEMMVRSPGKWIWW